MFNVLLDALPEEWNGYPIDSDFQTGIQISQCMTDGTLNDREKWYTAIALLFPDEDRRPPLKEAMQGVGWFLNEFNHDRHGKSSTNVKAMDFDVDQWRIYAAFRNQYGINLNRDSLHWFEFMGLLSNLEECSFGRVVDIRQKKVNGKMSAEERKAILNAKRVYALTEEDEQLTMEEKEKEMAAIEVFNEMRNKGK